MSDIELHVEGNALVVILPESHLPEWPANYFKLEVPGVTWWAARIGQPETLPDGRVRIRAERFCSPGDPGPLGDPGPPGDDSEPVPERKEPSTEEAP